MARNLSKVAVDKEDIISYECNFASKVVNILVGVGSIDLDGNFIVAPNQTYRSYSITGSDFDNLMSSTSTKPANVFRKDDLWEPIDKTNREKTLAKNIKGNT